MFESYPSYSYFRLLHFDAGRAKQQGEDVYGLQLALNSLGWKVPLVADGVLGAKTGKTITAAQRRLGVRVDGVAGQGTQTALALGIAEEVKKEPGNSLPEGLPDGQIHHESSYFLGAYSPIRDDGSYDAGVVQRNTKYHRPKDAFDPVDSIRLLCGFVRDRYELYQAAGHTPSTRRQWELAVGAWNAPYFANYLAGVQPWAAPDADDLAKLEAYISSCCAFLHV